MASAVSDFPTVLISGLGLMGGSLAAALTAEGWPVLLHHHRPGTAARAAAAGWGRACDRLEEAAAADLAVVCTPVSAIAPTVRSIALACPQAVITDVGSTKGGLCAELMDVVGRFVGSHPMAGSHCTGLDAADPQLYCGRLVITTPLVQTPPVALALVERLWIAVGCRVVRLDPVAHDCAVAEASHLPHLMACATAAQLSAAAAQVAAGGFRDTTRVAAGSPALWSDILCANRAAVGVELAAAIASLQHLQAHLKENDAASVTAWLAAGHAGRQRFAAAQPTLD